MEKTNRCKEASGKFGRSLIFLLGACAIASSSFSVYSCQFFSYRTKDGQPWEGLAPPFDTMNAAAVGLFSYSSSRREADNFVFGDNCIDYNDWSEVGQNNFFHVAQWCGVFAPVAGLLGWLVNAVEVCCFSSTVTMVMSTFYFLAAAGLQASTFLVFADTEFCFQSASMNACSFENGAWYSLGAAAAYLLIFLLLLTLPRSTPLGFRGSRIAGGNNDNEDDEHKGKSNDYMDTSDEEEQTAGKEESVDESEAQTKWLIQEDVSTLNDSTKDEHAIIVTEVLSERGPVAESEPVPSAGVPEEVEPSGEISPSPAEPKTEVNDTNSTQNIADEFLDMLCGDPHGVQDFLEGKNVIETVRSLNESVVAGKSAEPVKAAEDVTSPESTDEFPEGIKTPVSF